MKQQILSVALSLGMLTTLAQVEKVADSKITNVTVFLNKAQVMREASARIEAGKTNLVIAGLTSQLDPQSIQVTGKGSIVNLGISHRQNFLNEFNVPKGLKALRDSVESLQKQATLEQSQKEILNKEEQMLVTNQKIGGTTQKLNVAELKGMADFYRSRLGGKIAGGMRKDEKKKKNGGRGTKMQQKNKKKNKMYSRKNREI